MNRVKKLTTDAAGTLPLPGRVPEPVEGVGTEEQEGVPRVEEVKRHQIGVLRGHGPRSPRRPAT